MAKFRCAKTNCTRAVKKQGDLCWQHKGLEDQLAVSSKIHRPEESSVKPALEHASHDNPAGEENASTEAAPNAPAGKTTPTGLAALLRIAPPPEPDGLLIPFSREEIISLIEADVTREHIREFVVMGLSGKLTLVDSADPLAISRANAAA